MVSRSGIGWTGVTPLVFPNVDFPFVGDGFLSAVLGSIESSTGSVSMCNCFSGVGGMAASRENRSFVAVAFAGESTS